MAIDPKPKPVFEHSELEADIEKLSAEVKDLHKGGAESGREAVKKALHGHFYAPSSAPQSDTTKKADDQASNVLPNYLGDAPAEIKYHVKKLIDFAWHKGILAAIKLAKESDPLVMDAFHDALTDKLHDELEKRGQF